MKNKTTKLNTNCNIVPVLIFSNRKLLVFTITTHPMAMQTFQIFSVCKSNAPLEVKKIAVS